MSDVTDWLNALNLPQYVRVFAENDISMDVLAHLTAEDLKEIGIKSIGDRRKLLVAISCLAEPTETLATTSGDALLPSAAGASEAERRHLSVLFCDIVGSTELARRLDPEAYRSLLLSYQNAVAGEIGRMGGFLAKFMGDGVLGYFGFPKAHEDDAERAVRAALAIVQAVSRLGTTERLHVRIGIASGLVVVGDVIGSGSSLETSVIGETPNLASRLQSVAEADQIVVAPATRDLLGDVFEVREISAPKLKGYDSTVPAFAVVGERKAQSRFEARQSGAIAPMVGRDKELGFLLDRWSMAKSGEGQAVLLTGEAGIGKSRLVRALFDEIGDTQPRLFHQCSPHATNTALFPVVQRIVRAAGLDQFDDANAKLDRLEQLLESGDDAGTTAALFADLVGVDWQSRYGPLGMSAAQQRSRTLDAVGDHMISMAGTGSMLCVFEDVHWSDPTTLELIELYLTRIPKLEVLLILTSRPGFQPGFESHPIVSRLTLNRLGRRQIDAIAQRFARGRQIPPDVLQVIAARTDGVPLFVEELTKTVLESSAIDGHQDSPTRSLSEVPVPMSLQDSLMARLDQHLPAKEVAQVAACIGREFSYSMLSDIASLAHDKLQAGLDHLVRSELVFARGKPPHSTYVFKHALVRDAGYETLLKSRREAVHYRIARWLEGHTENGNIPPETIAAHFSKAGQAAEAVEWWTRAANHALEQSAYVEASRHFSAALKELSGVAETDRAAKELLLQIGLGSALTAVKGYSDPLTGSAYHRAHQLAEGLGDAERLFPTTYGIWNFEQSTGQLYKARAIAEQMLAMAKVSGRSGPVVAANSALGTTLAFLADWSLALEKFRAAMELYDEAEHRSLKYEYSEDPCVQALVWGAYCQWSLGYPQKAFEAMNRSVALASRTQHVNSIAYALSFRAILEWLSEDRFAALRTSKALLDRLKNEGLPLWVAMARVVTGWATTGWGDGSNNVSEIEAGIEMFRSTGHMVFVPQLYTALADALIRLGRYDQAMRAIEEGLTIQEFTEERCREAEFWRLKALCYWKGLAAGNEAERLFKKGLQVAHDQDSKSLQLKVASALSSLLAADGRRAEAILVLSKTYGQLSEGYFLPYMKNASYMLAHLRRAAPPEY